MSRPERKRMVQRGERALSLSRQCCLLDLSRSSLYYRAKDESAETLALMRRIDELFLAHPFYRSRQMVRHLRREGIRVGRHRVRRLMRLMGIATTTALCAARLGGATPLPPTDLTTTATPPCHRRGVPAHAPRSPNRSD